MIDRIPIPLCCFTRACRCRSFKGEANYGDCAAKVMVYYGFHGHLLITAEPRGYGLLFDACESE